MVKNTKSVSEDTIKGSKFKIFKSIGLALLLVAISVSFGSRPVAAETFPQGSIVTADGEAAALFGFDLTGAESFNTGFGSAGFAVDLAYDATRNDFWLARSQGVARFDNDTDTFSEEPDLSGGIPGFVQGIGVGGPDNNLLVVSWDDLSSEGESGVTCFDLDAGTSRIVSNLSTADPGDFEDPGGVAVMPSGRSFIADTSGEILEVDCSAGDISQSFSGGLIQTPRDVELKDDGSSRLAVLDGTSVFCLDVDTGEMMPVTQGDQLVGPSHLTTLGHDVYVLESRREIIKVDMDGEQSSFGGALFFASGLTRIPGALTEPVNVGPGDKFVLISDAGGADGSFRAGVNQIDGFSGAITEIIPLSSLPPQASRIAYDQANNDLVILAPMGKIIRFDFDTGALAPAQFVCDLEFNAGRDLDVDSSGNIFITGFGGAVGAGIPGFDEGVFRCDPNTNLADAVFSFDFASGVATDSGGPEFAVDIESFTAVPPLPEGTLFELDFAGGAKTALVSGFDLRLSDVDEEPNGNIIGVHNFPSFAPSVKRIDLSAAPPTVNTILATSSVEIIGRVDVSATGIHVVAGGGELVEFDVFKVDESNGGSLTPVPFFNPPAPGQPRPNAVDIAKAPGTPEPPPPVVQFQTGSLVVADRGSAPGKVILVDPTIPDDGVGGNQKVLASGGPLVDPQGVHITLDRKIYVIDPAARKLFLVDHTLPDDGMGGNLTEVSAGQLFRSPSDVVVGQDGNAAYVVDPDFFNEGGSGAVIKVDLTQPPGSNQTLLTSGVNLDRPTGIAMADVPSFGANPTLFVADPGADLIVLINAVFGNQFGVRGGADLVNPIRLDAFNGDLYIDNAGSNVAPGPIIAESVIKMDQVTNARMLVSNAPFVLLRDIAVAFGRTYVTDSDAFPGAPGAVFMLGPGAGDKTTVSSAGNFENPDGIDVVPTRQISVAPGLVRTPSWVATLDPFLETIGRGPTVIAEAIGTFALLDVDGDGILNHRDDCDQTPPNQPINKHGCSSSDLNGDPIAPFSFDNGTLQGFTTEGWMNPTVPPTPLASQFFQLHHSNAQFPLAADPDAAFPAPGTQSGPPGMALGSAGAIAAGLQSGANIPACDLVFFDFKSPMLTQDPDWQGIDGYQASVRAAPNNGLGVTPCPNNGGVVHDVFAQFILEYDNGDFAAETDPQGQPVFHELPETIDANGDARPVWESFTAYIDPPQGLPAGAKVKHARVRIFTTAHQARTGTNIELLPFFRANLDLVTPHKDSDRDGISNLLEPTFLIGEAVVACVFDFDCDDDGVIDGPFNSEDINGNGVYQPELGETDPTKADTDGDGLLDGQELCLTEPQTIPGGQGGTDLNAGNFIPVSVPCVTTDPRNPDTDGDGVNDGADNCASRPNENQEDANQDGIGDACAPTPPACPDDVLISNYQTEDSNSQFVEVANVGSGPISIDGCSLVTFNVFTETSIGAATVGLSGELAPGQTTQFPISGAPAGPGAMGIYDVTPPPADGTPFATTDEVTGMVYLNNDTVFAIGHLTVPAHDAFYDCIYGGSGQGGPFGERNPLADCFP